MSKYPKINFIGNKEKIASWILENLPLKRGTVVDLFCGGCSISYVLKENGYKVISNDALYSNFVLAKAIIENDYDLISDNDLNLNAIENISLYEEIKKNTTFLADKLYYNYEVEELNKIIYNSMSLREYKNYMFLSLLRRAMIRKLPYSRMNIKWEEIKKLRDEDYSYKKYGRYRHYHNISFLEHMKLNKDDYNLSVFQGNKKCIALNYDALECIRAINEKIDIVYIDPPYPSTMNKYYDFYGSFDKMLGMENKIKLDLTNKDTFISNFLEIIKLLIGKANYVVISLNNRCFPSSNLLIESMMPYVSKIKSISKEHNYQITGKLNKNRNFEILIIAKLKSGI